MKKIYYLLIAFFFIFNIFNIQQPIVKDKSQIWENSYGKLEVYPIVSESLISHRQFFNATSYLNSQYIDLAFRFDFLLSNANIYIYKEVDHVERHALNDNGTVWEYRNTTIMGYVNVNDFVDVEYYNGYYWYILKDIYFEQDETKHGYIEYDVPINSNGKWDLFIKRSSDTLKYALDNNLFVHLDPWWSAGSNWDYCKVCNIANSNNDYQIMINVTYSSGGDVDCESHCQADFDDVRFVNADNDTELDYWLERKVDSDYAYFWVELPSDVEDDDYIMIYYGYASAISNSDGDETFIFFDDFLGSSVDNTKWYWNNQASLDINVTADSVVHMSHNSGSITAGFRSDAYYTCNGTIREYKTRLGASCEPYESDRMPICWTTSDGKATMFQSDSSISDDYIFKHGAIEYSIMDEDIDFHIFRGSMPGNSSVYLQIFDLYYSVDASDSWRSYQTDPYEIYSMSRSLGTVQDWYIDWVRIRNYESIPSTWSSFGDELEQSVCECIVTNPNPSNNSINVEWDNLNLSVLVNSTLGCDISFVNITMSNGTYLYYKNYSVGSYSNDTYFYNTSFNLTGGTEYTFYVNVSCNGNLSYYWFNFTTIGVDLNLIYQKLLDIENNMIGVDDEVEIGFNENIISIILTFGLFIVFFYIGYTSQKRSGGAFMLFSGFIVLSFEILTSTYLNALYLVPLLTPVAIFLMLLGGRKWLYPTENERVKSEGQ